MNRTLWALGYLHGSFGKPRESTSLAYRQGYDRGFTEHLRRDDWPVHQPPAPEAPIPGIHYYSGCDPDRPRVNPDGTCEGCGERACPVCGKGGPSITCPECGQGRLHYMEACCGCGIAWKTIESVERYWLSFIEEAARV